MDRSATCNTVETFSSNTQNRIFTASENVAARMMGLVLVSLDEVASRASSSSSRVLIAKQTAFSKFDNSFVRSKEYDFHDEAVRGDVCIPWTAVFPLRINKDSDQTCSIAAREEQEAHTKDSFDGSCTFFSFSLLMVSSLLLV
jgi:hypothetical protein